MLLLHCFGTALTIGPKGLYNDHHFHYGYHVYGAAVATKHDTTWGATFAEQFLLYARDYMNPSQDDTYFVPWRLMDWFAGHSWAGGISLGGGVAYYNGRNQESSSESIHSYYAAALYGKVLRNVEGYESVGTTLEHAGRVALATELRSTDTYWHVYQADFPTENTNEPNVYGSAYRPNSVVGILWSNLAQYQTWFGSEGYYVHGIQQVPYTPISEQMLPYAWVKEEYSKFSASCTGACATNGWQTFVVLEESILDVNSAWNKALLLPDSVYSNDDAGGNGNSRSNTLYFIATR
jgi:endo-1,3(4)-beta-glucanase